MEKFATEEEIANIVFAFSGDVYALSDALRFLNINDYDKPMKPRFLCWLIGLKLIPPDRMNWIPEIYKLSDYYRRCLERYVGDCYQSPLDSVSTNSGVIRDNVHAALPWFNKFAAYFGLDEFHIKDAEIRIQRIFAVCIHDANGFKFNEAYTRVAYLAYLLSLIFSAHGALPLVFAEAMAHHIARALISILAFNRNLDDMNASEDHHNELQRLTKQFCPEVFQKLRAGGINFFEFSDRWERNMFADEHAPLNIFLIWDQIIFHITEFRYFLRFLVVAHYRAMINAKIDFNSDESILDMRWDAMAIIDDVEYLIEKSKENPMNLFYQIICPCFPFLRK
ncbi:hypothetical protein TRFO_26802 [Tritrichomonas foetus]|uniref:Rab-GAP TBC domain-containing protein n=1 Tax=Tritrichomonas foetus TaxID=1144522 RepID=A0A1J4K240_9EUKA|nr:hypothetical protein TRFO_26802 [Tritrichomonas foetus]|eukprot:OHT05455.1 hypothetical protein TRFO_26802 [Tritrichomonas foetus]